MRLVVFGGGYVGICTALQFALKGHDIDVIDPDSNRINQFLGGAAPFYEPGLDELISKFQGLNKLNFFSNVEVSKFEYQSAFVCVGTPSLEDGSADLSAVKNAMESASQVVEESGFVFVRSSCPPGSFNELSSSVGLNHQMRKMRSAIYPEFLREGSAVSDMQNPDRIVVGCAEPISEDLLKLLFLEDYTRVLVTNPWNAAMIKYANNGLLATLISFGNAISEACENSVGGDSNVVLECVLSDRRWKCLESESLPAITSYLAPGIGFGGSCLPKDVSALANSEQIPPLTRNFFLNISETNLNRLNGSLNFVKQQLIKIGARKILIAGVAFKEGTDDLRNSPALDLMNKLSKDFDILWSDPHVAQEKEFFGAKNMDLDSISVESKPFDVAILTSHDVKFNERVSEICSQFQLPLFLLRNQKVSNSSVELYRIGVNYG